MDRGKILTEIGRFIRLLSATKSPRADFIAGVGYLKALVESANKKELPEVAKIWESMKPTGAWGRAMVETGQPPKKS